MSFTSYYSSGFIVGIDIAVPLVGAVDMDENMAKVA
jgi:hypothetical protein